MKFVSARVSAVFKGLWVRGLDWRNVCQWGSEQSMQIFIERSKVRKVNHTFLPEGIHCEYLTLACTMPDTTRRMFGIGPASRAGKITIFQKRSEVRK